MRRFVLLVAWGLCLLPGCSPDKLTAPTYSPDVAARQALAEYDKNGDGFLDAKELEQCPALKSSLEYMDANGDNRLSADEIVARVRLYQESQVALTTPRCRVFLDGKGLEGALVTYVPEKFLGSSIKTASGYSDAAGLVKLVTEGQKFPGAQPGFYRVQVSKKNAKGEETIPARYNKETILGTEVSPRRKAKIGKPDNEEDGVFRLSSKCK